MFGEYFEYLTLIRTSSEHERTKNGNFELRSSIERFEVYVSEIFIVKICSGDFVYIQMMNCDFSWKCSIDAELASFVWIQMFRLLIPLNRVYS